MICTRFSLIREQENMGLKDLETYYYNEHKDKIFCTELCVDGKCFYILYDYDKQDEIEKFVSNFTEYFPYYVYNGDALECIKVTEQISEKLAEVSKRCWSGPNVPGRDEKVNGIFGEVFLDFYERIIKKNRLASTYASRRDFNSNYENRGFDNVLFKVCDNDIELIFAESKFVVDKSSAQSSLIKDIKGEPATPGKKEVIGHLTDKFMNDYITFVVEKNALFSEDDKKILKSFFAELNDVLINKNGEFISFLINKNIKVNCVFFAIFKSQSIVPSDYIDAYNSIEREATQHLESIGFKNFSIEIVFIPTFSKSMEIKGAIDKYYE